MYFDLDGRAGSIRMLLGHGNITYTDSRLTSEEFGKMKKSGDLPLGSMPVWKEEGFTMCQNNAILRMLGVRHGYYSDDPMTCWRIDSLVDYLEDKMKDHFIIYGPMLGGNPLAEDKAGDWFAKFWDMVIPVCEARLVEHGKKFLGGTDRPTIADFKAF